MRLNQPVAARTVAEFSGLSSEHGQTRHSQVTSPRTGNHVLRLTVPPPPTMSHAYTARLERSRPREALAARKNPLPWGREIKVSRVNMFRGGLLIVHVTRVL